MGENTCGKFPVYIAIYEKCHNFLTMSISPYGNFPWGRYEYMRIWGYEYMRIWGYECMRIWGYEDTLVLPKDLDQIKLELLGGSSLWAPHFPFPCKDFLLLDKRHMGGNPTISNFDFKISLAISSLRGSRCFFNNSQLILIICLKFCTFRSYNT